MPLDKERLGRYADNSMVELDGIEYEHVRGAVLEVGIYLYSIGVPFNHGSLRQALLKHASQGYTIDNHRWEMALVKGLLAPQELLDASVQAEKLSNSFGVALERYSGNADDLLYRMKPSALDAITLSTTLPHISSVNDIQRFHKLCKDSLEKELSYL